MRIIGVIDLKDGQAVHARGGRRNEYTAVAKAAGTAVYGDALKLASVYRNTFGLTEIYVADLDAIASAAPNDEVVGSIGRSGVNVLVDGGVATADDARRVAAGGAHSVIVGLETLRSFETLRDICRHCPVTFSLDLRDGIPMSPVIDHTADRPEVLAGRAVDAGVAAIVVLDVARVGTDMGPDVEMLKRIRLAVGECAVLAGGGVRSRDDLEQLSDIGCNGALVASALHDGRLTPADVSAASAFYGRVRRKADTTKASRDTPPSGRSSPRLPSRSR